MDNDPMDNGGSVQMDNGPMDNGQLDEWIRFTLTDEKSSLTLKRKKAESEGPQSDFFYIAELESESVSASTGVYEISLHGIIEFSNKLARDWKGWSGKHEFESLEGDLRLSATHNGIGKVTFRVELRDVNDSSWSAMQEISIAPGELDALARKAKQFVG